MSTPTKRRHPLQPERFLEEPKQIWAAIFTVIGCGVMGLVSYGVLHDPTPFLTYFTGIGVTFILGASANSVMQSYKVDSTDVNAINDEEVNTNIDQKVNDNINSNQAINGGVDNSAEINFNADPKDVPRAEEIN